MGAIEQLSVALGGRATSERTLERLQQFVELVLKWNPSINVIARSTADAVWIRHIVDSVQVFSLVRPEHRSWVDMGSGGGFPGMVVAILAADLASELQVTLVESDKRKSVFLSEASRQLGLKVNVKAARIEDLPPMSADVVSARALAPLAALCPLAFRHLAPTGMCVFLKGAQVDREIEDAKRLWKFDLESIKSVTEEAASLIVMRNLRSA